MFLVTILLYNSLKVWHKVADRNSHHSPVKLCWIWPNLEQIASEGFFVINSSLEPPLHHIKSFLKVTHPKGPNLHKFKMAAVANKKHIFEDTGNLIEHVLHKITFYIFFVLCTFLIKLTVYEIMRFFAFFWVFEFFKIKLYWLKIH